MDASPPLNNLDLNAINSIPRQLQQVSTIKARKSVVAWMVEDEALYGVLGLYGRTIRAFFEQFQGQKSTNVVKASWWWQQQEELINDEDIDSSSIVCPFTRS